MKRLLVLPILMLGLSFACDQPYEEVFGIKIGCSVEGINNFNEYTDLDLEIDGANVFHLPLNDGNFFDSANILVINGGVEGLILRASGFSFDPEIMDELIESLTNRWGAGGIVDRGNKAGINYAFNVSDIDSPLSAILVNYELDNETLSLVYRTKKHDSLSENKDDEIKKKRDGQFNSL